MLFVGEKKGSVEGEGGVVFLPMIGGRGNSSTFAERKEGKLFSLDHGK